MNIKALLITFCVAINFAIFSDEALHPFEEMRQGTPEGERLKEYFFQAKNNIFCKEYDREKETFSESQCDHSTQAAYQYFNGQQSNSIVPELVFESKQELKAWAQQQQNSYLIAYKPGCISCANLLAAIETRIQDLQARGQSVFMVNVRKNQAAFNEEQDCWYYNGTPEVWSIKNGNPQKIFENSPAHHYFEEFIARKNS